VDDTLRNFKASVVEEYFPLHPEQNFDGRNLSKEVAR